MSRDFLTTSERDTLMRHRANAVASALWGLNNAQSGEAEPRRWLAIAPKVLSKNAATGGGAVEVEMGDGTRTLGQNRVPTQKGEAPGYLPIRVNPLNIKIDENVLIDIPRHSMVLFKGDYLRVLEWMPKAWSKAWQDFERGAFLLAPFGLVVKKSALSASFRVNTSTSDSLLAASLLFAEICKAEEVGVEELY